MCDSYDCKGGRLSALTCLFEQPDDLPFCIGTGFGVPDFTRRLCSFETVLLDPVRGGIVASKQFGKMAQLPSDYNARGFPTLKLLRFDVPLTFHFAIDGNTGLNWAIFRFVDGTVINAKWCTDR